MSGLRCTACGSDADYGARFCERCGAQLLQRCSHCGHQLTWTALFCSQCGTSVDPVSPNASAVLDKLGGSGSCNSIGGFPLRKDRLILGKYCECPANVNGRKEGLRIEVSALLNAATNAVRETNAVPL